jgi:hypothetical protein
MTSRLDSRDVEAIARRVAELLADQLAEPRRPKPLMSAAEVAAFLGIDAEFVRDHADELQALRLGDGPKARLRFRPEAVEEFLVSKPEPKPVPTRRRRRRSSPSNVKLLPIRGDGA